MPAVKDALTQAEIVAVVCHERYTLGGGDQTSARVRRLVRRRTRPKFAGGRGRRVRRRPTIPTKLNGRCTDGGTAD